MMVNFVVPQDFGGGLDFWPRLNL